MQPRTVARQAVVALAVGTVGFLLMSQLRSHVGVTQRLEAESETDLTRIFSRLNEEDAALRDEVAQLQIELQSLDTSQQRDELARQTAERQVDELRILAGTAAAHGPGVVVRIDDPAHAFTFDLLLDLVQELRDAGAEAIAVDNHRVGMATAFGGRRDGIDVDEEAVGSPYEVVAIGDPATLEGGLKIPGGAIDTLSALNRVQVAVVRRDDVNVPALVHPPTLRAARPIE